MAKCFYDPNQYIGSEMWFLLIDDLLRGSGFLMLRSRSFLPVRTA